MDSTTIEQINLPQLEQDCANFCGFLRQIRELFSHDPRVVRHATIAEDSIFKMTEQMHGIDIDKFAGSKEPANRTSLLPYLFWEEVEN